MRPEPPRPSRSSRIAAAGRDVWRAAVGEKVAAGRLRDLNWPYGLNAVGGSRPGDVRRGRRARVAVRAAARIVRAADTRTRLSSSTPVGLVWLVTFLVVVGLTVFAQAALHGPWWLKVLGVAVGASLLMIWGVTGGVGGHPAGPGARCVTVRRAARVLDRPGTAAVRLVGVPGPAGTVRASASVFPVAVSQPQR